MSTQVQHRRGTSAQHMSFTGAMSEFTHDTTNDAIRVHNGSTPGGNRTLMESDLGGNNGIARLDEEGQIPLSQMAKALDRANHIGGDYEVHFKDFASAGTDNQIFSAALTALQSKPYGGRLILPAGKIDLTGSRHNIAAIDGKNYVIAGQTHGGGTVVDISAVTDQAIYFGRSTGYGGGSIGLRDIYFKGSNSSQKTAIVLERANITRLRDLTFDTMRVGVLMSDSFAVRVEDILCNGCGDYSIVSTTGAHNLVIARSNFFGGGVGVFFAGLTDNVSIVGSDFEGVSSAAVFNAGGSSLLFQGNYVEYQTSSILGFGADMTGADISNNWLALGAGAGANWTVTNMNGGQIRRNRLYNQSLNFGAGCKDIDEGDNSLAGTGNIGSVPWNGLGVLTNGWAAGSRVPGYTRRGGVVYLRGQLVSGATGNVAFTLPSGYRPRQSGYFAVAGSSAAAGQAIINATSGGVALSPSSGTEVNLDGISFPAN